VNAGVKAGLFVLALGAVFAAAFGVGTAYDDEPTAHAHAEKYELRVIGAPSEPASRGELRFVVEDHDGAVVTDFELRHEKRLHLIAVDTGYAGYQHLHPTMAPDGTWTTPIGLAPGVVRVYADFRPAGGEDAVARTDLRIAGPVASPAYSVLRTQRVGKYTVTALGDLVVGDSARMTFEIGLNGAPVDDLQPYLGAYGHLVMLRDSDGAYQHVHPEEGPAGPAISFAASAPTSGRYHLYLDFKHGGVVRTAHFVLEAAAAPGSDEHDGQGGMDHGDH